ncbi:MAG: hypothetical protein K0R15_599 [Clostridiales bacterium]|jgi:uncharacterized protein YxeA|nr:hypothetical protein [Clostridiales bacterium]
MKKIIIGVIILVALIIIGRSIVSKISNDEEAYL